MLGQSRKRIEEKKKISRKVEEEEQRRETRLSDRFLAKTRKERIEKKRRKTMLPHR
jgi:hypothetical protein